LVISGTAPIEILVRAKMPKPTIPAIKRIMKNLDLKLNSMSLDNMNYKIRNELKS
jgi:glycine betaine/choline ABC-type transport system substrate-binding protein